MAVASFGAGVEEAWEASARGDKENKEQVKREKKKNAMHQMSRLQVQFLVSPSILGSVPGSPATILSALHLYGCTSRLVIW